MEGRERMVTQESKEILVIEDCLEKKEIRVHLAEAVVEADRLGLQESGVHQAPQDRQAKKDMRDLQEKMVYLAQKVVVVCPERLDPKVATARRANPVCLVLMVLEDKMDKMEVPDLQDPKENLDFRVFPAEAYQDPKDEMALQVVREEMV